MVTDPESPFRFERTGALIQDRVKPFGFGSRKNAERDDAG
jgi:hypothetical protein